MRPRSLKRIYLVESSILIAWQKEYHSDDCALQSSCCQCFFCFFSDVHGKEERLQHNLKIKRKSPPKYSEFQSDKANGFVVTQRWFFHENKNSASHFHFLTYIKQQQQQWYISSVALAVLTRCSCYTSMIAALARENHHCTIQQWHRHYKLNDSNIL